MILLLFIYNQYYIYTISIELTLYIFYVYLKNKNKNIKNKKKLKARRRRCPQKSCNHIHAEGNACHIFIPGEKKEDESSDSDDSDSESSSSESSSSSEEEEDSDDDGNKIKGVTSMMKQPSMRQQAKEAKQQASSVAREMKKAALASRLSTPEWASKMNLKRCNCIYGVPTVCSTYIYTCTALYTLCKHIRFIHIYTMFIYVFHIYSNNNI